MDAGILDYEAALGRLGRTLVILELGLCGLQSVVEDESVPNVEEIKALAWLSQQAQDIHAEVEREIEAAVEDRPTVAAKTKDHPGPRQPSRGNQNRNSGNGAGVGRRASVETPAAVRAEGASRS